MSRRNNFIIIVSRIATREKLKTMVGMAEKFKI
jgi:hypothetical protein